MNAGKTLFPMLALALVAGCSPGSNGQSGAKAEERPGEPREAVGSLAMPDMPPRREEAAEALPASSGIDAAPLHAGEKGAGRLADAGAASAAPLQLLPMKPSVVNIPPPPYVPDLPPSDGAADLQPFPDEVTRYMVDRDGCDHFRGEEAYDAERLAYLQDNIAALCTGTDARLALLRHRYAHDPAVMSALSGYDDRIEGNASQ
ncbi:hypothetical protein Sj15T_20230 [Sphingobium sp. TA15]|uniref:Energy transducer TonB n=1 Tax=Sphingobium indicum (strain DSM 16413 / CCM 7287 / MTCC 6362 / UT26 / NBRC 101211 / UT26S) TaxID=452662 RepID=D4Z4R3_SPHIU|nr:MULTISPECIES: hypothetical protein [Sphingobium]EQB03191.1 hypothetical protein L286_13060 [Sphingobium sp. HDIP04]BAI97595.1 hypothetical protein SJA_C1-27610 [Sphingobium indicum UT26S]BDD67002.1 hypothetical protein Sj15T_20230 [Sphingobium sp. TA15]